MVTFSHVHRCHFCNLWRVVLRTPAYLVQLQEKELSFVYPFTGGTRPPYRQHVISFLRNRGQQDTSGLLLCRQCTWAITHTTAVRCLVNNSFAICFSAAVTCWYKFCWNGRKALLLVTRDFRAGCLLSLPWEFHTAPLSLMFSAAV